MKVNKFGLGQDIFQFCPSRHNNIDISFNSDVSSNSGDITVRLNDTEIGSQFNNDSMLELWYANQSDPKMSETACARYRGVDDNAVACTTRILPMNNPRMQKEKEHYNILSILIDPISRAQMERSLPMTLTLLDRLNFLQFQKFTTVGKILNCFYDYTLRLS